MGLGKAKKEELRVMLREAPGAAGWSVHETPWSDTTAAQVRTAGGKLVAEVVDPDDAKLLVECVRVVSALCEER